MKQSAIEKVVAEMRAERTIVDKCWTDVKDIEEAEGILGKRLEVLDACIARLSGSNGSETPKPTRTRKRRTATGTDL